MHAARPHCWHALRQGSRGQHNAPCRTPAADADQALLGAPAHNQVHHRPGPRRGRAQGLGRILDAHDQAARGSAERTVSLDETLR